MIYHLKHHRRFSSFADSAIVLAALSAARAKGSKLALSHHSFGELTARPRAGVEA